MPEALLPLPLVFARVERRGYHAEAVAHELCSDRKSPPSHVRTFVLVK